MKTKFLLFALFAGMYIHLHAQYTAIPDTNFEAALDALGYDDIPGDGQVLTSDISGVIDLDVSGENIDDLAGIEAFTALQTLNCQNNQLITLEVRQNTNLTALNCNNNQLVGGLSLVGLSGLTTLDASGNPDLTCIQVDNAADADAGAGIYSGWIKDGTASYSGESCSTITLGAGSGNNSTGNANTFIGYRSGLNTSTGHSNTFIGSESGYSNQIGFGNLFLGHRAGYNETGSNFLYIDNSDTNEPLIWGDFANNILRINGSLSIYNAYSLPTDDGVAGQVLSTNGSGMVSWGAISDGDELGDHNATQNITLNSQWLSGDGDSEGITIDNEGNVSINATPAADGAALTVNGPVKIGNITTPGSGTNYNLYVENGILTEKVRIALEEDTEWSWPDYVFKADYPLKLLTEVEVYIKQNKHLPGIPSAEEVARKGIDLAQMDAKLLEKIEELTLYTIQQQKTIQKQQKLVEKLIERVEHLENQ